MNRKLYAKVLFGCAIALLLPAATMAAQFEEVQITKFFRGAYCRNAHGFPLKPRLAPTHPRIGIWIKDDGLIFIEVAGKDCYLREQEVATKPGDMCPKFNRYPPGYDRTHGLGSLCSGSQSGPPPRDTTTPPIQTQSGPVGDETGGAAHGANPDHTQ